MNKYTHKDSNIIKLRSRIFWNCPSKALHSQNQHHFQTLEDLDSCRFSCNVQPAKFLRMFLHIRSANCIFECFYCYSRLRNRVKLPILKHLFQRNHWMNSELQFRIVNLISKSFLFFRSYYKLVFFILRLATANCKLSIKMLSSRAFAMERPDRRTIGTECQGCEKFWAHCIHMNNTGAVSIYVKRRVMHSRTRTISILLLHCVQTCPTQHKSAEWPSWRGLEEVSDIFGIFGISSNYW